MCVLYDICIYIYITVYSGVYKYENTSMILRVCMMYSSLHSIHDAHIFTLYTSITYTYIYTYPSKRHHHHALLNPRLLLLHQTPYYISNRVQ